MFFENRKAAGIALAKAFEAYQGNSKTIVVGLVGGGLVVASQLSEQLQLPCGLIIVEKIGAPENPELALGAISNEGEGFFNDELIAILGVSQEFLRKEVERLREVVISKKALLLSKKPPVSLKRKTVIVVDDGIATGASMKVAIESLRTQFPEKIVMAVPVASREAFDSFSLLADEVVCLETPVFFDALSTFYRNFPLVSNQDLKNIIDSAPCFLHF